jgi:hypothetical protein
MARMGIMALATLLDVVGAIEVIVIKTDSKKSGNCNRAL